MIDTIVMTVLLNKIVAKCQQKYKIYLHKNLTIESHKVVVW